MEAEKGQAFHNVSGPLDLLSEKAECVPYALFTPRAIHSPSRLMFLLTTLLFSFKSKTIRTRKPMVSLKYFC